MTTAKDRLKSLTREDMLKAFKTVANKGFEIFKKKSEDYDVEFYKEIGAVGPLLRIKEKQYRLEKLLSIDSEPNYEGIKDNIEDIYVLYGTLLAMFQFELVSLEQLKKAWAIVVEYDVEANYQPEKKKKWWQFWKR